jgi:hypothetical protein
MGTVRYKKAMTELHNLAGIPAEDIFDYGQSKIAVLFDRFYNFCQDNLTIHCTEYDIQPARFYFRDDTRVNARAGKKNNYYIIEMNMGLVLAMYEYFYTRNTAFNDDAYLAKTYRDLFPADAPPDFVMYQVAIQFTYYHELGHLVQKSPELNGFLSENYTTTGSSFSMLQHLKEFDADIHAAQMIYFHIYEFWKKLPDQQQTSDSLFKFIAVYLSGIFVYFTYLEGEANPLYFAEHSHPHPLVRITYIMDVIIGVAEKNLIDIKIDGREVLREAFNISERIAVANKYENPVDRYGNSFVSANKSIADYIQVLITKSNKESFLVKNRY